MTEHIHIEDADLSVLQHLTQMADVKHLSHALLLLGEAGVGALATAVSLAEHLVGRSIQLSFSETEKPDKDFVLSDRHDVFYVYPIAGQLTIGQMRSLQQLLSYSHEGNRVVILEGADCLPSQAANALLKTLEEPPVGVYFILLAADEMMILPTILSRVSLYRLTPMTIERFTAWAEKLGINQEMADLLFHMSGGNPGIARQLQSEGVRQMAQVALRWWQILQHDQKPFTELIALWNEQKGQTDLLLRWLALTARDMLLLCSGGDRSWLRCYTIADELTNIASHWQVEQLLEVQEILADVQDAGQVHINETLRGDVLALRMIALTKGEKNANRSRGAF